MSEIERAIRDTLDMTFLLPWYSGFVAGLLVAWIIAGLPRLHRRRTTKTARDLSRPGAEE